MSKSEVRREFLRRAKAGFPWGIALVYLVFVLGNAFTIPRPEGGNLLVVPGAMAEAYGSPVAAALAQFFWSGLLGAALNTMEVPSSGPGPIFWGRRRCSPWRGGVAGGSPSGRAGCAFWACCFCCTC